MRARHFNRHVSGHYDHMVTLEKAGTGTKVRIKKETIKLPILVWIVVLSSLFACFAEGTLIGFRMSGYAWLVPLFAAVLVFLKTGRRIRLPLSLWMPWIAVVVGYLLVASAESALQRSIMLLCPIFVGVAVSTLRITEEDLYSFRQLYRYMAVVLCLGVGLKTGLLLTGRLPSVTGLAPQVMTGALLCTLFAATYVLGEEKDLIWWGVLATIPVIAVTRMGMIATGLSLPFTFAPMKPVKRVLLFVLIIAAGYGLFFTKRVQEKSFYSGSGTIQEVSSDNPNFATSGRKYIWEHMEGEIDKAPWFGHGANASEPFVMRLAGLTHPHNDWLRLLYDYGYFGTIIFAICMLLQVWHLLKTARGTSGETRILFLASATSFLVFSLFMVTDNIILYAAFFGNLQFTILGLAYASHHTESEHTKLVEPKRRKLRIRW